MAKRTIEVITSDLTGEDIPDGKARTIAFSYDGTDYSIDLTVAEGKDFDKAMKQYIEHAEQVTAAPPAPRTVRRASTGRTGPAKRDPEQLRAIRDWARGNGWPNLGDRGRIPYEAENAYNAAH